MPTVRSKWGAVQHSCLRTSKASLAFAPRGLRCISTTRILIGRILDGNPPDQHQGLRRRAEPLPHHVGGDVQGSSGCLPDAEEISRTRR